MDDLTWRLLQEINGFCIVGSDWKKESVDQSISHFVILPDDEYRSLTWAVMSLQSWKNRALSDPRMQCFFYLGETWSVTDDLKGISLMLHFKAG